MGSQTHNWQLFGLLINEEKDHLTVLRIGPTTKGQIKNQEDLRPPDIRWCRRLV